MNLIWSIVHFDDLSVNQLFDLLSLRTEVFIVEQNCPYQDADEKDRKSYHVMGYDKRNKLMAVSRVLPPGISYSEISIGRIATSLEHRNKKYGHEMMQVCIGYIYRKFGKNPIRISAQEHLKKFYEKHGFIQVSKPYQEDGILHIEMLNTTLK